MEISVLACVFVLDNQKSTNIKKNDGKIIKILVDKNNSNLLEVKPSNNVDLDILVRDKIVEIIGTKKFYFEQAFSFYEVKYSNDNKVDIVYIAVTNIENIKNLNEQYELVPFKLLDNNMVTLGDEIYDCNISSKKVEGFKKVDYEIDCSDIMIEKKIVEILKSYEVLKNKISNLEVLSKFVSNNFTLEDIKMVYEMIKNIQVDKSNFRKRIIKYCDKVDGKIDNKGYRPTQIYKFKSLKEDIWV